MHLVDFIALISDCVMHIYSNCVGTLLVGDMYDNSFGFILYARNVLLYKRILLSDVMFLLQQWEDSRYNVGFVDICSWVGTENLEVGSVLFVWIARIMSHPAVIHTLI